MQFGPRLLESYTPSRRSAALLRAFTALVALWLLRTFLAGPMALAAQVAGPLAASSDPNYFKDTNGTVLVLNGSQTWNTFQDWGANGTVEKLDFDAFVKFLTSHGHNFTLLWTIELPKFCGLPLFEGSAPDLTAAPFPWLRTGPGTATDGGPKFDLRQIFLCL